jgi:DNA-binding NarL/FixJ family response regulator
VTNSYRVILVDDHVLVRQGLRTLVETMPSLEVVAEADDAIELLALLKRINADLVVLDISLPQLRGIEAIHEIKATQTPPKILMLTMHKEMGMLAAAMSMGASGYVLKEDAVEELSSAIAKIRAGGVYVSPKLTDELTADWASGRRADQGFEPLDERLTVREREILKLAAEGNSSRQIAELLHISHRTAEHHRASIMRKLRLNGTADLVKYAITNQYI